MSWVVAFQTEQQTYALQVDRVVRIIYMAALTPLLGVEQAVVGALNVQGNIVPIVDLRRHLSLPAKVWKRHTPIILVSLGNQTIGLIVDTVSAVLQLDASQILSAADVLPADWPEVPLLQGLVRVSAGDLWLLLNLDHLFQPDQVQAMLSACDQIMHAQAGTICSAAGVQA
ncbi:MAG TPA: chemotaxis protein CheW [Anaerolineae bacterium]|nr:chemotaxis protein CheW [Anaerolineae bacterium]